MILCSDQSKSALLASYYQVSLGGCSHQGCHDQCTRITGVRRSTYSINVVQRNLSVFNCPFTERDSKLDTFFHTRLARPILFHSQISFILSVALLAWRQNFSCYTFSPWPV